ncbi:hypothetical protein TNCV_2428561 [Trichonephila clavipes]|nr:hypothetical protein TNCV_2428561 [Trichonephila clavipes]
MHVFSPVISKQSACRNRYGKEAPKNKSILQWNPKFKKTVCLCEKKSINPANHLGRSSGEGEVEFCSKSTEVYESCRL